MMVKRVPDNIEDIMKSAKNGDTIAMQTLSGQLSGLIWREYTRQDTQIKPNDWYSEAQYVLYGVGVVTNFHVADADCLLRKGTSSPCATSVAT